jgi:hypothetical protein
MRGPPSRDEDRCKRRSDQEQQDHRKCRRVHTLNTEQQRLDPTAGSPTRHESKSRSQMRNAAQLRAEMASSIFRSSHGPYSLPPHLSEEPHDRFVRGCWLVVEHEDACVG